MRKDISTTKPSAFGREHLRKMEDALKRAIDKEVARRRAAGLPIHVWRDGKVVDLQEEENGNGQNGDL